MRSDRDVPVAIVGAGFSGTMVAAHLARCGIRSLLIEPRDVAGRGTAFSTTDPAHLLNVPAGNMSAWPDAPDDFTERTGDRGAFAERRQFGLYLREILDEAMEGGAGLVRDRAVAGHCDAGRWRISLESGGTLEARALVLAIGNQLPDVPPYAAAAAGRLIADPWGEQARRAIADATRHDLDVLIIGTGLTMVDVVLSLGSAGHRGNILALSRRGLAPRGHRAAEAVPVEAAEIPTGNARALLRWLRLQGSRIGWRAAVDSLRPHSQHLWQSFDPAQQRLFLRHARPWWDVHRHRIAPQVAARLEELSAAGRLEIAAGRISSIDPDGDALAVTFRRRGSDEQVRRRFAYVFNCTGPLHDIGRTRDPLLRQLLDDGLAKADRLGIGLEVDGRSRVEASQHLWALGALTKGRYWEIIAVPDIRAQAAAVAADIATELGL